MMARRERGLSDLQIMVVGMMFLAWFIVLMFWFVQSLIEWLS